MKLPIACTVLATLAFATGALGQAIPAVKEAGHATAETAKEGGDNIKAATEKQPKKSVTKTKAQGHKASAHAHGHAAKSDAKAAIK